MLVELLDEPLAGLAAGVEGVLDGVLAGVPLVVGVVELVSVAELEERLSVL